MPTETLQPAGTPLIQEYGTHKRCITINQRILNFAMRQNSPKGAYSWLVNSQRNVAPVER
jgi:hypothetical protein